MLTITDDDLELELNSLAQSTHKTIQQVLADALALYAESLAVRRADESYADYLRTGESVSLDQFIAENDLDC